MLSESLRGVVAQALLPRADGRGRVPVIEVLVNTAAVSNLIREGKTFQISSSMQTGHVHGMMTFETSIHNMIQDGVITREDGNDFLSRRHGGRGPSGYTKSAAPIPSARKRNAERVTKSQQVN